MVVMEGLKMEPMYPSYPGYVAAPGYPGYPGSYHSVFSSSLHSAAAASALSSLPASDPFSGYYGGHYASGAGHYGAVSPYYARYMQQVHSSFNTAINTWKHSLLTR